MYHAVERLEQVVYLDTVGQAAGFDKVVLTLRQTSPTGLALQDNKVTAHFGPGMIRKKVIGQADSRNRFAMFHQPLAHRFLSSACPIIFLLIMPEPKWAVTLLSCNARPVGPI